MGERRMFHTKVIESDAFYGLPEGAQNLYVHMCMVADDDGFVNNSGAVIARMKGGKQKLNKLVESRFLLKFDDVYVIKHWRMANTLKSDRKKPLTYPDIAVRIWVCENRAYTDHPVDGRKTLFEERTGIQLDSKRIPTGFPIEEKRIEQNIIEPNLTAEQLFELVWEKYPYEKRGDKNKVLSELNTAIRCREDADRMMANLEAWKHSDQWYKNNGQYIPYLYNWIARGTWMSAPEGAPSRKLDEDEERAIQRMLMGG